MRGGPSAAGDRAGARLARFALVGLSGVLVNLAVLQALAGRVGLPEGAASALAIEASIVTNFLLHDAFTFKDRRARAGGRSGRLLRYHAVSAVGAAVQLATFLGVVAVLSRALPGLDPAPRRTLAQAAGIALAFAASWSGSARFAWGLRRPAAPAPRGARLAPAAFGAVLALHVLPIWLVRWFPTQDGPLHVENVLALLRVSGSPLLQAWYVPNWGAQPNWLTQGLLAALLTAASPVVAEKLVLTGYTVLFPLAFRTLLPRGPRGWWAALAAFPFVHGFPFHMGFWNFSYGMALALLAAGLWGRWRGRLTGARGLVFAGLSVLLFVAHSVAFAGALVGVGGLLAGRAGVSLARARRRPARRARVVRAYARRAAGALAAASPGLVLVATWILAHSGEASARFPLGELVVKLAAGYAMVSIDRRELLPAALVVAVLGAAALHALLARRGEPRRLRPADGWLVAAAAFAALYLAVPDVVAAGAHVSDRLALFTLVALAAWIVTGGAPRAAARRAALALAALAVVALGIRWDKQRELSSLLEEYLSAEAVIPADRVLLPVAISPHGPRDAAGRRLGYRIKPFLHATGWLVAEKGGVDLKNSQAVTNHCPVRFPPGRNPFRRFGGTLGRMEGVPPCMDLRAAAEAADYALVWGRTPEALATRCGAALASGLDAAWVQVYRSSPRGLLEVWRPRRHRAAREEGTGAGQGPSSPENAPVRQPSRIDRSRTEKAAAMPARAAVSSPTPSRDTSAT
jgi:putative flippase GtrA